MVSGTGKGRKEEEMKGGGGKRVAKGRGRQEERG